MKSLKRKDFTSGKYVCPKCDGTGQVISNEIPEAPWIIAVGGPVCDLCGGTGYVSYSTYRHFIDRNIA